MSSVLFTDEVNPYFGFPISPIHDWQTAIYNSHQKEVAMQQHIQQSVPATWWTWERVLAIVVFFLFAFVVSNY
jgi:hypothetical protein